MDSDRQRGVEVWGTRRAEEYNTTGCGCGIGVEMEQEMEKAEQFGGCFKVFAIWEFKMAFKWE